MNSSVVVIGMPESGKSSFIAALSHILEFKEVETALTLARLPDEAKYLHEMRSDWEICQPFERTKAGVHPIVFNLVDKAGGHVDLSFPDIAGEEFDKQWSSRIWSEDYIQAIKGASDLLLFLNVKTFRKPYSKADEETVQRAALELESDEVNEAGPKEPADLPEEIADPGAAIARLVSRRPEHPTGKVDDPTLWQPDQADEQAKLVDILQALADYAPNRQWRLGIVVSAWEIVDNATPDITPKDWVQRNVPLLRQYLESNPESFHFAVFGVSAQGGDPEDEAERLLKIETPSDRVLVVTEEYRGNDLTKIITWVMVKHD